MYPHQQNPFQNGYQQANRAQYPTGFFSQIGQPSASSVSYPTHQFGSSPFGLSNMPLQSTSNLISVSQLPSASFGIQQQGFFTMNSSAPSLTNNLQLTHQNTMRSQAAPVLFRQVSARDIPTSSFFFQPTANKNSVATNGIKDVTNETNLANSAVQVEPDATNVSISEELHIDFSNVTDEQRAAQLSEDFTDPKIKRTVINEHALAKIASSSQSVAAESALHSNGSNFNSPESVELIPSTSNDPNQNKEIGNNWRILMLFNGQMKDTDLPSNCERPQMEQGKQFPYPECRSSIMPQQEFSGDELEDEEDNQQQQQRPSSSNQQTIKNIISTTTAKVTLPRRTTTTNSHGYVLPNGTTWVRRKPEVISRTFTKPIRPEVMSKIFSTAQTSQSVQQPLQSKAVKRPSSGYSMRILKNGKRLYAGNNECYQFNENGTCMSGIFCIYKHDNNTDHWHKRVCHRLLKGTCREQDGACPHGSHSLLPHQMPLCDFYIKMICSKGKDQCPYLHVRHTPGMEPCPDFNKGCCQRGILVCLTCSRSPATCSATSRIAIFTMWSSRNPGLMLMS